MAARIRNLRWISVDPRRGSRRQLLRSLFPSISTAGRYPSLPRWRHQSQFPKRCLRPFDHTDPSSLSSALSAVSLSRPPGCHPAWTPIGQKIEVFVIGRSMRKLLGDDLRRRLPRETQAQRTWRLRQRRRSVVCALMRSIRPIGQKRANHASGETQSINCRQPC